MSAKIILCLMAAFQKQFHPKKILMIGKSGLAWQDFLQ
jgi:hypothetical protein